MNIKGKEYKSLTYQEILTMMIKNLDNDKDENIILHIMDYLKEKGRGRI